jgi:hypothetical protein
MAGEPLIFRVHAIQRMAQRGLKVEDVRHVLDAGEVIENYPNDHPYPSTLVLGWVGDRAVHVIAASAPAERIVITVYEPDLARWEPGFKKRKP